jgi:hypothetical protein
VLPDVGAVPVTVPRSQRGVTEELTTWQNRALDPLLPIVYPHALWMKIRNGSVANRPVYLPVGVDLDGCNHILGQWIGPGEGEGARFWMSMLAELTNRGIADRSPRRRATHSWCRRCAVSVSGGPAAGAYAFASRRPVSYGCGCGRQVLLAKPRA